MDTLFVSCEGDLAEEAEEASSSAVVLEAGEEGAETAALTPAEGKASHQPRWYCKSVSCGRISRAAQVAGRYRRFNGPGAVPRSRPVALRWAARALRCHHIQRSGDLPSQS